MSLVLHFELVKLWVVENGLEWPNLEFSFFGWFWGVVDFWSMEVGVVGSDEAIWLFFVIFSSKLHRFLFVVVISCLGVLPYFWASLKLILCFIIVAWIITPGSTTLYRVLLFKGANMWFWWIFDLPMIAEPAELAVGKLTFNRLFQLIYPHLWCNYWAWCLFTQFLVIWFFGSFLTLFLIKSYFWMAVMLPVSIQALSTNKKPKSVIIPQNLRILILAFQSFLRPKTEQSHHPCFPVVSLVC